jgi:hypothetical protein
MELHRLSKERVLDKHEIDVNNIVIIGHFKNGVDSTNKAILVPFVNEDGYPFDVARVTGIPADSFLRKKGDAAAGSNRNIEVSMLEPHFGKQCNTEKTLSRIKNFGHGACSFQTISCSPIKTSKKKSPIKNQEITSIISIDTVTLAFSSLGRLYKLPDIAKQRLSADPNVLFHTETKMREKFAKACVGHLSERLSQRQRELDNPDESFTITPTKQQGLHSIWCSPTTQHPSDQPVAVDFDYTQLLRSIASGDVEGSQDYGDVEATIDDDADGQNGGDIGSTMEDDDSLYVLDKDYNAVKQRLNIRVNHTKVSHPFLRKNNVMVDHFIRTNTFLACLVRALTATRNAFDQLCLPSFCHSYPFLLLHLIPSGR